MDALALYGRDGDRDTVTSVTSGFTLVVGDSGIGKSSFLASLNLWPGDPLLSSPIVLKSLEGSLQTALADAIGDCMSQYLNSALDPQSAWGVVKSIGARAKTVTGREIGRAVLSRALSFAESKLGKDVVDIGKKVLGDVSKGGVLGFDDQLAAIRVPDRAQELCDIAAEFSRAAGRPLVLRFDNAERLAPSDHGLLAELVDAVVGQVRIVVCVTPHHSSGDEIIRAVSLRGSVPHELLPLARPAIETWLMTARVPQARWDTIITLSSGYPFFIADAVRLSGEDVSLNQIAAPNGFEALMRASWTTISEGIRATAARLAPFVDPPSDDFLLQYLGFDALQWGIVADSLLEAGIFVRRSDETVWFHDRRRAFIWEKALNPKSREHVAEAAFAAVASWLDCLSSLELWVPSATALLARVVEPASPESSIGDLLTLSDGAIALLWGLIEVIEPGSIRAPYAEIGEVVRHAGTRSGLVLNWLATMKELEARNLIETREADDVRLVRSKVRDNTEYAALLGEIQLRFHVAPRPRLASAAFDAIVRPVMGAFDAAVITLGRSSLADHKAQAELLRDPNHIGNADKGVVLGATLTIDDQQVSFTATFAAREARDAAERTVLGITKLTSRVQVDRVVTLPKPRLRYARYRLAAETLGLHRIRTEAPQPEEIIAFLDLRAKYAEALGTVSTSEEREVLDLGLRRYLVDMRRTPDSWTSFEVRTGTVAATQDVTELALDPRDPLLELKLRDEGFLTGAERIVRTITRFGRKQSIPHPLAAVVDDIDEAGKKYNSGLRSVLFGPDPELLEQEILEERERLRRAIGALESVGVQGSTLHRRSLLVGFWEDTDAGWGSDFGNWSTCVLEPDDDAGAVVARRLSRSPLDTSTWPEVTVPDEFADHVGLKVSRWHDGDASYVIAPLLGYGDHDARMMDLNTPLGQMIRKTYDVVGERDDLA